MVVTYNVVTHKAQLAILLTTLVIVVFYGGSQHDVIVNHMHTYNDAQSEMTSRIRNIPSKKNVLFIMSDDLRPQLNCYKGPHFPNPNSDFRMHTPSIDKLAEESILFRRAYVQLAICGPSRASLLTGRRPDTISEWHLTSNFRLADR